MVYRPIADVVAVVCVPSSRTVTSEIGSPPTVVTVPVIVICWANALPLRAIENRRLNATARRPGNTRLLRDCLSGDFLSIVILQWRTRSMRLVRRWTSGPAGESGSHIDEREVAAVRACRMVEGRRRGPIVGSTRQATAGYLVAQRMRWHSRHDSPNRGGLLRGCLLTKFGHNLLHHNVRTVKIGFHSGACWSAIARKRRRRMVLSGPPPS